MTQTKETPVKKIYQAPEMQVFDLAPCALLAASGNNEERYNYLCPHIPETRCRVYNRFMRHERGIFSSSSITPDYQRISLKGTKDCPQKDTCEAYKTYTKMMNERQR